MRKWGVLFGKMWYEKKVGREEWGARGKIRGERECHLGWRIIPERNTFMKVPGAKSHGSAEAL